MQTFLSKKFQQTLKHWYLPLIVGLFFIIVSIIVFASPKSSLTALAILFAISFLFGGIAEVVFSLTGREQRPNWGWSLALGIITLLIGIELVANLGLSISVMVFYVGFLLMFRSIAAISFSVQLKQYGTKSWGWVLAFGSLGAVASFVLLLNPVLTSLWLVLWIGLSFLFTGLSRILFALQLRKLHKRSKVISPELQDRFEQIQKEIRQEWEKNF